MERLIDSLREVLRATAEEEAERASGDGYNWGYCGARFVEARQKAEATFAQELEAVIDARVQAALGKTPNVEVTGRL